MAALIDEYKQAIQDVLDGRAKEAPRPSELPWTEDKLASMWAAAAAELIAEENSGGGGSSGGGVLVVNVTTDPETYAKSCDKTAGEIMAVADVGGIVVFKETNEGVGLIDYMRYAEQDNQLYTFKTGTNSTYEAASASDYPIDGN